MDITFHKSIKSGNGKTLYCYLTPDFSLAELEEYFHMQGHVFEVHENPNDENSPIEEVVGIIMAHGPDVIIPRMNAIWDNLVAHEEDKLEGGE